MWKNNIARRVSSKRLLPSRRPSVPPPLLCRRIQAPAGTVKLCPSLACGGACLRARTSPLSFAALPLLPNNVARITNNRCPHLTHHDRPKFNIPRLSLAAARRYHSLRVSPASHPPKTLTPLAITLLDRGHASQHRPRGERSIYGDANSG